MNNTDDQKYGKNVVSKEASIAIETRTFGSEWTEVQQFTDMPHAIKRLKYLQAEELANAHPAAFRIVHKVKHVYSF